MSWLDMMEQQQRDIHDARRRDEKAGRNRPELSQAAKERKARVDAGKQLRHLVENDEMRITLLNCCDRIDQLEDDVFGGKMWSHDDPSYQDERIVVQEHASEIMEALCEIRGLLQKAWNGSALLSIPVSVANEDGSIFGESDEDQVWVNAFRMKKGR